MSKKCIFSLSLIILLMLVSTFSSVIAPNDPLENNISNRFEKPSITYPFGTDELGRCVFSRIIYGTKNTMEVAMIVVIISAFMGLSFGCISGYVDGYVDNILMGVFDVFMSFPPFVYVMVLIGLMGNGKFILILSMILSTWVISTKMVRNMVKVEKNKDYIKCAKLCGTSDLSIILKHIMPNIIRPLIVFFSMQMGDIILLIAGFSFLGLGMSADVPEWGMMISTAKKTIYSNPCLMIYPGMCIFISVFAFNSFAENFREAKGH